MKFSIFLLIGLVASIASARAQALTDTLLVYPSPFQTAATIHFELANTDTVTLKVYNMLGQTVATLFDHVVLPSGSYNILFHGDSLSNGFYLVRLEIGISKTLTQKLVKTDDANSIHQPVSSQISLSPNPTADFINIPVAGAKTILIIHSNGLAETIKTNETQISLRHLYPGVFTLQVLDRNDRIILTQKIIKTI